MLPGFSGLEVMRQVREQEGPAPGIILLTARGEEHDRVSGLRQGADDYLVKPFSPAELVARVEALGRRLALREEPAAPDEQPLVFDGLVIDLVGRRVLVGGTEVELTQREFDLLAFLAAQPGARVQPRPADGRRLGVSVLHRHLHGHGARAPCAVEDRGRPGEPGAAADRVGRRLPVQRMSGRADLRLLAVPAAVALLGGLVVGLADSWHGALVTVALLAAVGVPALALAVLATGNRDRLGSLRRQFALIAAIAAGQLIATAVLFALVMFLSPHDALLAVVVGAFCGAVALVAARLLAGGVLGDVEHVRDGLEAVGEGRRDVDFSDRRT